MPDWGAVRTVLISLLPGIFWITYLRSLSAGRVSVWWKWVIALLAGWASTELTLALSDGLGVSVLNRVPHVGLLIYYVFGVGLVEEAAKAMCAIVALRMTGLASKPLTVLQLSCGVALGFATAENVLYARNYGDSVILFRFVLSTLGHLLFSALWGFALGTRARIQGDKTTFHTPWKYFLGMLLLSALTHGLYDWFLSTERAVLALLLLAVMWVGFREAVLGAFLNQEYQREVPFALEPCPDCSVLTRAEGNFCSFCGETLSPEVPSEETLSPEPSF